MLLAFTLFLLPPFFAISTHYKHMHEKIFRLSCLVALCVHRHATDNGPVSRICINRMRAMVLERYGSVESDPLKLKDMTKPKPSMGHVIVKVSACGVCHTDLNVIEK